MPLPKQPELNPDFRKNKERNDSYKNDFKFDNASFKLFLKTMLFLLCLLPGVWI